MTFCVALLLASIPLVAAETRRVDRPRINKAFYSLQHLELESLHDGYISRESQLFTKHVEVLDEFGAKTMYKYRIQKRSQPIYQVNNDENIVALECDIDQPDALVLHFADMWQVDESTWTEDMFVGVGEEWQCAQENNEKFQQEWRYVESLQWQGNALHMRTKRAGLADVFESFKMHFRYDPPKVRQPKAHKSHVKLQVHDRELDTKQELLVSFSLPLASASWNFDEVNSGALEPSIELYSIDFEAFQDISFLSVGAGLAVNCRECYFDFHSAIEFVLETEGIIGVPTGISEFRIALTGGLQYRFELELEANAQLILDNPFENEIFTLALGNIGLPFTAGLIGLSPEFTLTGYVDATGNVVARINGVGVELPEADGDFMLGYEWTESGGSRALTEFPGWFSPLTPNIEIEEASFELNAGIYPIIALTLNIPGFQGLTVGAEMQPEFTFRFEIDDDTCDPLSVQPDEGDIPELPALDLLSIADVPGVYASNRSSAGLQQFINLPDSLLVRYDIEFGMFLEIGLLEDIVLTAVFFIPITVVDSTTFDLTLIPTEPMTCSFCSGCFQVLGGGSSDSGATRFLTPQCEESEVTLSCSNDDEISLVSVFYGATETSGVARCSGSSDDCTSTTAFGAVQAMCEGTSSCTFTVSNDVLGGDPCRTVVKFFEAEWVCSNEPEQDDIRLADGASAARGRVEVFNDGAWGTVCDTEDSWSLTEADTVCHQLGLGLAIEATNDARFGQGDGTIWLSGVDCDGDSLVTDCVSSAAVAGCEHENDVGVTCTGPHLIRQNPGSDGRFWLAAHGPSLGTVATGASDIYYHLYPGSANFLRVRAFSFDPESNVDLFVYESTERLDANDPLASASQTGWGHAGRDEVEIDLRNDVRTGARDTGEFHAMIVEVRGVGAGSNDYSVVVDSFTDVEAAANGISSVSVNGIYRTEYQFFSYIVQSADVTAVTISTDSVVDLFATASSQLEFSTTPDRVSSTWSSNNENAIEFEFIPIFSSFGNVLEVGDEISIGVYGAAAGDTPYTLTVTEYAEFASGDRLDRVTGSNQYELHLAAQTQRLVLLVTNEADVPVEFNVRFLSVAADGSGMSESMTVASETLSGAGETAVLEATNLVERFGYRPIFDVNTAVEGSWSATFGSVIDIMVGQSSEFNLYAGRHQFFSVNGLPNMPTSPNRLLVRTSGSGAVYVSPSVILPRGGDAVAPVVGTIPAGTGARGLAIGRMDELYPTSGSFYGGIISQDASVGNIAVTAIIDLTGERPWSGSLRALESHTFTFPGDNFLRTPVGMLLRLTLSSNVSTDEVDLYAHRTPSRDAEGELPVALDQWTFQSTSVGNDGIYLLKQDGTDVVCDVPSRADIEPTCFDSRTGLVHIAVAARNLVVDTVNYTLGFEYLQDLPLQINRAIEDVFLQNASTTLELELTTDDFLFDGPSLGWDIALGAFVESSLPNDPNGFLAVYSDILNSTNLRQAEDGRLMLDIPARPEYAPADDELITFTVRETLTMSNAVSRVQFTLSDGRAEIVPSTGAATSLTSTTPQLFIGVIAAAGASLFSSIQ